MAPHAPAGLLGQQRDREVSWSPAAGRELQVRWELQEST